MEEYEDYTKKELLEVAESMGITSFPQAKVITRPTNEEILYEIKKLRDAIAGGSELTEDKEDKDTEEEIIPVKPKKLTRAQIRRSQMKELMELKRVQIDEVFSFQTYSEDDSNRVEFVTWGNSLVGHHTTRIVFGVPWQVHVGALRNLEQNQAFGTVVDNNGSVSNRVSSRYRISYLDQLTEDEIDAIKRKQELRRIN